MRKLIVVVLVIRGLIVAADFGAAAAAEYQLAKQVREQFGLSSDPSVRINGFPFLTQALAGRYSAIDIQATGLPVDPLRDVAVEATLHDVDAPLSGVTSGDLHSVQVAQVTGRVRIKDSDIGRTIGIEDLRIQQPSAQEISEVLPAGTQSPGGSTPGESAPGESTPGESTPSEPAPGEQAPVRVVATTDLAGLRAEIIGIGVIELTGGLVRVRVLDVRLARDDIGSVSLPRALRQPLLKALSTDVKPGGLPFAVTPTAVSVETGSLVVEGTANNVTMRQVGIGAGGPR